MIRRIPRLAMYQYIRMCRAGGSGTEGSESMDRIIKRGDIFHIMGTPNRNTTHGSEQWPDRPAVIVSNNLNNKYSPVVEVVYLTGRTKQRLPTHVRINSAEIPSVALCEQVNSVSVDRLGNPMGVCTEGEMLDINCALAVSLGLEA